MNEKRTETWPVRITVPAMTKLRKIQDLRFSRTGRREGFNEILSTMIFQHEEPKK